MTEPQSPAMLEAMHELETRVNATVAAGITAVTVSITAASDAHHKALLEQERRNSTFADRAHVDDLSSQLQRHSVRIATLEDSYSQILTRLDELAAQVSAGTVHLLSGFSNYLVLVLLMLASNLLIFVLTHLH